MVTCPPLDVYYKEKGVCIRDARSCRLFLLESFDFDQVGARVLKGGWMGGGGGEEG
jgi:hypothetical protein